MLSEYNLDILETVYMKVNPSDKGAIERIKEPKVQAAIRAALFRPTPAYMIIGLEIAKGSRRTSVRT